MGYSRGWGGEGQLFPLSERRSPLSTATFLVPTRYFTALAPSVSHFPLDTSSERAAVLRPEIGEKEFSGNEVQLFKNFSLNVLQREKRREAQQPAYEPSGRLSSPTACAVRKTFSLEVLSMHLLEYEQRMNCSKQRLLLTT